MEAEFGNQQLLDVTVIALVLAILSGLTLPLDISPAIWHVRAGNIPACSLVFWLVILNLLTFANVIIWPHDNVEAYWNGIGFCDVEVRIMVGSGIGIPASVACIMRSLAQALDTENAVLAPSRRVRRRNAAINIFCCIVLPVLLMVVYYVIQPYRYDIIGLSGCHAPFAPVLPTIFLYFIFPPIISVIGNYYSFLTIWRIHRYRRDLGTILAASNTNQSHFFRLFIMALILILGITPVQIYFLIENIKAQYVPYSWSEIHNPQTWNQHLAAPSGGEVLPDRWVWIGSGYLVFFFFGMGAETSRMYRKWLVKLGLLRESRDGGTRSCSSRPGILSSLGSAAKLLLHKTTSSTESQNSFADFAPGTGTQSDFLTSTSKKWNVIRSLWGPVSVKQSNTPLSLSPRLSAMIPFTESRRQQLPIELSKTPTRTDTTHSTAFAGEITPSVKSAKSSNNGSGMRRSVGSPIKDSLELDSIDRTATIV
ncbi:STE3-domain-containing protein [Patellaria atrata CBS 101060]|uniref:STE3-domain-containing protein n=1 Tax=Patellaria atrata CBS 101060 TaxID=1346257 RepID=A0A9P4VRW6_9PEZI|nr:STE3-domain-containing protein [Patellaria atrata CBS 101060]